MELLIQKWGNSAAVRLPATLLSQLGVAPGDKLSAQIQPKGLVLRAARKNFSLADLMAKCDLNAPRPRDIGEWDSVKAVGDEI